MIQISDYIDIMLFLTFDLQFYVTFSLSMLQCVWFTMIDSCLGIVVLIPKMRKLSCLYNILKDKMNDN